MENKFHEVLFTKSFCISEENNNKSVQTEHTKNHEMVFELHIAWLNSLLVRDSFIYLDLVAGGFVPLPVGPSLSSAMSPNHVLIQLLRDIQVCHPNQVAAML